ncbi:MAG TPA: ABC transporter ATP-binding protein [Acidimicrobiales bacterium]|nr:ABC transporter ATP-binding protein [Acidimicrobiales bacterium]
MSDVSGAVGLAMTGLTKVFGDKIALSDVSIEIDPGTFLVLLGPSGSGKTTLLRCLAGIERPTSGQIVIGSQVVAGPRVFVEPERRGLAMVFQDYALWPHLSVRKNITFPLLRSALTTSDRDARVNDLLERVGISALADRFPNQLSGGEQQRVALARALAGHAGLILFDEPLSNLDADRREQLRIEIATLTRATGATVVYITHDQSEAFALSDRVGVLNQGRLVQFNTPEVIYRQPANAFVARFTGVAGEFRVESLRPCGENRYEVALPFAPDLRIEAVATEDLGTPREVSLFVRAAGVSLCGADDVGGARGVVVDVAFNGRGYEHVVSVGEGASLSKVFATTRYDRLSPVKVHFDPASCLVMESKGI